MSALNRPEKASGDKNMRWDKKKYGQPLVDVIVSNFAGKIPTSAVDVKRFGELMPGAKDGLLWNGGKLREYAIKMYKDGRGELAME